MKKVLFTNLYRYVNPEFKILFSRGDDFLGLSKQDRTFERKKYNYSSLQTIRLESINTFF